MIPTVPLVLDGPAPPSALKPVDSPMIGTVRGCIEDEVEDSGFMED